MDVDLLARMVKEVILKHDAVTLPGVGSFVADLVPAAFSDKGYTINPPYRRLYFTPKQGSDTLLVDLYAASNHIAQEDATRIVVDFLEEMKEVLKVKKTVVFPQLGRLRATRENHFFFVADEDLDIYPGGFGLEPISLKTHQETREEVADAVAGLAQILEPEPAPEPEPEIVEDPVAEPIPELAPEPEPEPEPEADPEPVPVPEPVAPAPKPNRLQELETRSRQHASKHRHHSKRSVKKVLLRELLFLLGLVVLVAIVLAVVGRVAPDWIDQFLYSPDELEILRK